jgi:glycosyltransferase involved in cell wall biosynthesis
MIHERYPEQVSRRDVTVGSKQAWCEAANVVFTISSRTRDDVLERFRLDEERVVVTPLGVRAVEPDRSAVPAGNPPFVLYVGQRQPEYKNFDALVRALARSESRHHTRLVCFGGGPLSDAERCLLQEHGLGDVVVAGGTDAALAAHYSSARALVYPSCYEGFGLPPLEAMMQGCPVVASTGGAIPEVVGDAAELFEPTDDAAMADAIDRVVLDDARRADLARLGHDRAASFTWDRTVDLTLAGYRQAQA